MCLSNQFLNGLVGGFLEKLKVEDDGNIVCPLGLLDLVVWKYPFIVDWVEGCSEVVLGLLVFFVAFREGLVGLDADVCGVFIVDLG